MERLLALLLILAAPLAAGPLEDAREDLARTRKDRDLYVGEGLADSADHKGDLGKALMKAREDARAALALSVQSVIRSKVSEKTVFVDGVAREEVHAESSAEATVHLRNLGYREYLDLPKRGQVTVLAFITKEDYRRMLAGLQLRAFHPENGVLLGVRFKDFGGLKALLEASEKAQSAAPDLLQYNNKGKGTVGPPPAYLFPMLEAHWRDFYAGFGFSNKRVGLYGFDEAKDQVFKHTDHTLNAFLYELGWDWSPLGTRLQPFLPLRLQAAYVELSSHSDLRTVLYPGWLYGATTGLGGRFWANEKLAVEGAFLWTFALNQAQLIGDRGPLRMAPGQDAPAVGMDGLEMLLRIRYSGF